MNLRVCGVLFEGDRALLIRHDYGEEQVWHVIGGGIKENETLEEAVAREYFEEANLIVDVGKLWLIFKDTRHDDVEVLHCVFIVTRQNGQPKIQTQSTTGIECKWISSREIAAMQLYPKIGTLVKNLIEQSENYPQPSAIRFIDALL